MIKVEIELDKRKIIDDGKYIPESILECMNDAFLRRGQQILESDGFRRVYRDSGNTEKDFTILGGVVLNLVKVDWFGNYVSKIMLYDSKNGINITFLLSKHLTNCNFQHIIMAEQL